jgi:hypothetical protein
MCRLQHEWPCLCLKLELACHDGPVHKYDDDMGNLLTPMCPAPALVTDASDCGWPLASTSCEVMATPPVGASNDARG